MIRIDLSTTRRLRANASQASILEALAEDIRRMQIRAAEQDLFSAQALAGDRWLTDGLGARDRARDIYANVRDLCTLYDHLNRHLGTGPASADILEENRTRPALRNLHDRIAKLHSDYDARQRAARQAKRERQAN